MPQNSLGLSRCCAAEHCFLRFQRSCQPHQARQVRTGTTSLSPSPLPTSRPWVLGAKDIVVAMVLGALLWALLRLRGLKVYTVLE